MKVIAGDTPDLLTPGEVMGLLRISKRTLATRADAGVFGEGAVIVTAGGHRRYRKEAVVAFLNGAQWQSAESAATTHLAAARTDLDHIAAGLLPAAETITEGD